MFTRLKRAVTKRAKEAVKEEVRDYIPTVAALVTLGILLLCAIPHPAHTVINIYM